MSRSPDLDRVSELFARALRVRPSARERWLDRHCGDDARLRAELSSLLAAEPGSADYVTRVAEEVLAPAARDVLRAGTAIEKSTLPGRRIGEYEVLEVIGAGGMAVVYRARDLRHDRDVALKVLRPQVAATVGAERFEREIRIAAGLSHPHILPVFDSGSAEGVLFYVMPLVDGESLRELLDREGRLGVGDAVRLTEQVASALGHAHDRGVVHRDIKPENILLTADQAIVADFGIARAVEAAGAERLTGMGLALGTPAYMAPEQATGAGTVDARADVYALGCVVHEMLAGRPPYAGATPRALLAQHAAGRVPRLRTSDPSIPLFLDRAVARAMAKDPRDRFPTPAAFASVLRTGTVVPGIRRRGLRRALAVAAGGGLLIAAGWGAAALVGGPAVNRLAVLPLTTLTADSGQEHLAEGVHEAIIGELARAGVPVIARTTMRRYGGSSKSVREIARELRVDGVVEGSLYRRGDTLEITARLYEGGGERELWSGTYDGDLPNVVALYRGIARAIADAIRLELTPEAATRLAGAAPVNPRVYEAYLRGMYHLNRSTEEHFEQALAHFERGVEENPADARALAGLALGYITLGHGPAPPPGAWQRGRAAAERALRLDPELAEAWAALADVKTYFEWDWEGAEAAFQRANELNPSLAMNHYHHAWYLVMHGRVEEALAAHRRARDLDPLTPLHTVWLPGIYLYGGQYERALKAARDVAAEYPANATALYVLGVSAAQMGEYDEAIAAHERAVAINPRWRAALGRSYALAGRWDDARRILADLEAEPPSSWGAIGLADLHTALGNYDEAFRWLEYRPAHGWLPWSRVNPALVPLRGDPRFAALLREMGLPPP